MKWSLWEVRATVPWLSGPFYRTLLFFLFLSHTALSCSPRLCTGYSFCLHACPPESSPSQLLLVIRVSAKRHLLWPSHFHHLALCPITLLSLLHGIHHALKSSCFLCLLTGFTSYKHMSCVRAGLYHRYLQGPEQGLVHCRYSINICWMSQTAGKPCLLDLWWPIHPDPPRFSLLPLQLWP